MENESKKKSLRERLRVKYRVSVLDELTLSERWHFRLNGWGAIVWIALLFLLALALFSLLILYTPIRNYLPGYSENIRQQLIVESSRLDSMGTSLELQRQYLNIIKQVVAGEVESDTVQSLDSMQIIMREQLLEAKSEATAEFIAQYEAKRKIIFNSLTWQTPHLCCHSFVLHAELYSNRSQPRSIAMTSLFRQQSMTM